MNTTKQSEPTLRVKTRPNDANKAGDIFGGWLMSQIDTAGAITAARRAKGAVATVAVKELKFLEPLFIYDIVSFYTEIKCVGKTSVKVQVDAYAERYESGENTLRQIKVSEAELVYVAISKPGEKRSIPKE